MTLHDTRSVRANGIDIHYVEAGTGEPLLILNNGMISTHPIWKDWPSSHTRYIGALAERFRVITADARGSGRTVHTGGPITYDLLADDALALIDALDLKRPLVWGYGDGAVVATIVGFRSPGSVKAIVHHGGYNVFHPNPESPSFVMTRQMLGGNAAATKADPDAVAASPVEFLRTMVALMKADHDVAQGAGHWKTVLAQTFDRASKPSRYSFENLRAVTAPMLILVGDRDRFCTVEDGVAAYRSLPNGELAVLPNTAPGITDAAVAVTTDFFVRHASKP